MFKLPISVALPKLFLPLLMGCLLNVAIGQEVHLHTVAFYNLENFFDPLDNPDTFDDDYTPEGRHQWTDSLFRQKTAQLAKVIAQIGRKETQQPPVFLGVAEAENLWVLQQLARHPTLRPYAYEVVHFESPDARGIDVGLLYQKKHFILKKAKAYALPLVNPNTQRRRTTRDQLVVSGFFGEEELVFLVNHWPSRRGGERKSNPGRMAAARLQQRIIDSLQRQNAYVKIISMGDFNDNPTDKSLRLLSTPSSYRKSFKPLYNPMESLYEKGVGSLAHRNRWHLFDQILISQNVHHREEGLFFLKAGVFNPSFLHTPEGTYRGYPYRNHILGTVLKGYSDHFPVYVLLAKPVR